MSLHIISQGFKTLLRWNDDEDPSIVVARAHAAGFTHAIVEEYYGCLCGIYYVESNYNHALYAIAYGAYDYPDKELAIMDIESGRLVSHAIPDDIWNFVTEHRTAH